MLDQMQGIINQKTNQNITCASNYRAAANHAAEAGVTFYRTAKSRHGLAPSAALLTRHFSAASKQAVDGNVLNSIQPYSTAEKPKHKIQNGHPQKLIHIGEKKKEKTLKGFLNICKINLAHLAAIPENNGKKRLNYCTGQLQNDLLLMPLNCVQIQKSASAKPNAADEPNPIANTLSYRVTTWRTTLANKGIQCFFFYTYNECSINQQSKAAQWLLKLSSICYFPEKPTIKKALEPPSI